MDVNVRNLNLNGRFGFELEGVFFENALVQNTWRDVVRMSLSAPVWLELFAQDLKDA
jgi:RimJ/RimL family protein N-acetyltransferase